MSKIVAVPSTSCKVITLQRLMHMCTVGEKLYLHIYMEFHGNDFTVPNDEVYTYTPLTYFRMY